MANDRERTVARFDAVTAALVELGDSPAITPADASVPVGLRLNLACIALAELTRVCTDQQNQITDLLNRVATLEQLVVG